MSWTRHILRACAAVLLALLAASALAQKAAEKAEAAAPAASTSEKPAAEVPDMGAAVTPTKSDIAESQKLYQRALRLSANPANLPEAFGLLEESTELNPTDIASTTAREFVREAMVAEHMERGNGFMEAADPEDALVEFREALALDPTNTYAGQRVHDATSVTKRDYAKPVFDYASEPVLAPKPGKHTFTYKGDSRQLITNIARAFGLEATFDASYSSRPVKVNLENVTFETAMHVACLLSHCFQIAASPREMIIANDSQDVRRNLERTSVRTFYVPVEAGAQALPEVVNILRSMLELRFMAPDIGENTITIRAPRKTLDAVAMIIDTMTAPRPQVLLEIRVLRLDESAASQIGVAYPLQFTLFNLNTEAQKLGPQAVGIIDRLKAGTATSQDLAAAAALLASGGLAGSVFSQGFATFGGGTTASGIAIPPATFNFNASHSLFKNVEHVTLRATQGQAATFRVGDRFPVITASYSPIIAGGPGQSIGNGQAQPIIPAYTYEDLGVTLKATPQFGSSQEVTLNMDLAVKALGTVSLNNIPTISNRQYVGTITLRDGETSVVAGSVDHSETRGVNGMPWLSSLPGFGRAFSSNSKNNTSDQLMILVTPHILTLKPETREMPLDSD